VDSSAAPRTTTRSARRDGGLEAANDRDHGIECEPADVSCDGPAGGRFVDVVAEWRAVAR